MLRSENAQLEMDKQEEAKSAAVQHKMIEDLEVSIRHIEHELQQIVSGQKILS